MKHSFSNFITDKKWYIIHTKESFEQKIIEILTKKKIENFHPITKTKNIILGELPAENAHPLFPEIIFVFIHKSQIREISGLQGVCNFLYWHDSYAVVSAKSLENIRAFTDNHENISIEKTRINEKMIQPASTFSDKNPTSYYDDNGTDRLMLPELGVVLIAEVKKKEVSRLQIVV